MDTQTDAILKALQEGVALTQQEVYAPPFNCTRLAARIKDLRDAGHPIKTEKIKNATTRGKHARYTYDTPTQPSLFQ